MLLRKLNRKSLFRLMSRNFATIDPNKDYYKTLGVDKNATESQIKTSYYKLALKYHPDHFKGNQSKFKQINQAYTILSNNQTRKQYEQAKNLGINQNYNNYNQGSSQGYDPYRDFRNQQQRGFYQDQNYQYNWQNPRWQRTQWQNNQWQNTQWQKQQKNNRAYYQNPYDAFQQFRRQYQQVNKQRINRRRKQYQQYIRQHDQFQAQVQERLRNSIRSAFVFGLFFTLLIYLANQRQNKVYVDQNSYGHGYIPGNYRNVGANGVESPYPQNISNYSYR